MGGKKRRNGEKSSQFWADQIAKRITGREMYHYLSKKVPRFSEYVVKTSASISGVLHIGRLSDTVRGASVFRALKDEGEKARFIWVAEDMDPLRKVPAGVPESYRKHIGTSVSTLPDPEGCHNSYAGHHTDDYFKVLNEFVFDSMERFSMQEEYGKGSFNEQIRVLIGNAEAIRQIQNKHRRTPLSTDWSPWTPVCENCGKIITPRVEFTEDRKVTYECRDYQFETTVAEGCGYKGEADPLKDAGKLAWKSEWAAQWARWKVVSEGAGKEYQVPNSAFWINAEILEKVLDFPMPEPIFYEHLTIEGVKMSASLGNVVYPRQWLEVAPPQLLSFFFNKRLMTSRSFSWKELPLLYDEYDSAAAVYLDRTSLDNEKERSHIKRLFEISNPKDRKKILLPPSCLSFSHAAMVAQVFENAQDIVRSLKKAGHYNRKEHEQLMQRVALARKWVHSHVPEESRYVIQPEVSEEAKSKLSERQAAALREIAAKLKEKSWEEKELFNEFYDIAKKNKLNPPDLFKAAYLILLNKERGPKLAPFLLALGDRAVRLLEQV